MGIASFVVGLIIPAPIPSADSNPSVYHTCECGFISYFIYD